MNHPRNLPPSEAERVRNILTAEPGLAAGQSKALRRTRSAALGALRVARLFAIVEHGDDGTVSRPGVLLVLWVGAATPANGEDFDFWYPATM